MKSDSGSEVSIIDRYKKEKRKDTSNSRNSDSSIEKPTRKREVHKKKEKNSSQS